MVRFAAQTVTLLAAVLALAGMYGLSLVYASPFARSWDEVDFALALGRFDLLAMQPHFPGYPYFIIGGILVHQWISDPVQALVTFNAATALSSAIPIFLLARRHASISASLFVSALVLTTPYLWLMAARPMSESAGIALLWWFLWSVRQALEHPKSYAWHSIALVVFGFLMGTRLSFFPFGAALLLLWSYKYKLNAGIRGRKLRLLLSIAAAGLIQSVWVVGLALSEGTLTGFWKLSAAFVKGHFSEWGGGVVSTSMPFGRRVAQLFGNNLVGDVLLGRSILIGLLLFLLLGAIFIGKRMLKGIITSDCEPEQNNRLYQWWLILCIAMYILWALFGQNIEKPRHIAPIAGPLLLLLYLSAVRTAYLLQRIRAGTHKGVIILSLCIPLILTLLFAAQLVQGADLLKRQSEQQPAVYQLHEYVRDLKTPVVLYTWEETRVLQYLRAEYDHRRIVTYDYFKAVAAAGNGQRILLTDHVLKGFEQQDPNVREHVIPLAVFKSDSLFDPVYAHITLYEWLDIS